MYVYVCMYARGVRAALRGGSLCGKKLKCRDIYKGPKLKEKAYLFIRERA